QWYRPNAQFEFNELLHDFSDDEDSLKRAMNRLGSEGITPLHESIAEALLYLAAATPPDSFRALFVFSDGLDNQEVPERPVIELSRELRIPIYTVGYNEDLP